MYLSRSDRSSATSSRQFPHLRTSFGSGGHRFGTFLEATQRGVSRGVVDHRGCGDDSALLATAVAFCHGEGIDPLRSEVPQPVAPNLRVYRAVSLQSPRGEPCRDHPAAADTAVDGVVLSPSVVLVGGHHRRASAPGAGGCQVDVHGDLLRSTNGRFCAGLKMPADQLC